MSENKKYCCSNRVEVEAWIVGSADLMLSMFSLGTISFWAYSYYFDIENLEMTTRLNPGLYQNTEKFLRAESETRSAVLVILLFMSVAKLCSCCVLLIGSYHKNLMLLKIWLLPGVILYVYLIIVAFVMLYHVSDKLLFGLICAVYLLFQLYILWIAKELIKDLTSIPSTSESQIQLGIPVDASFSVGVQNEEQLNRNTD